MQRVNLTSQIPKWVIFALLILSLIGFSDSSYLTFKHYQGEIPPCSILEGCEVVTTSEYSIVGGVPVALLGALFYLSVFLFTFLYFDSQNPKFLVLAALLTPFGFIASVLFVYIQLFVLGAICVYCMGSAVTSTLLFVGGLLILKRMSWTLEQLDN